MPLESELRQGLAAGQLDVYYQPIIRLADRSVAGFEALLRWQHPVKGLISPADFIAHSEETGLIVELGRFALERAATDLAREKASFDVIFIDGNHRFDDVLTDFYLYASLCADRGFVIFDDLWMPSIQSVVSFVRANRTDFEEQSTGESNIAVFQKTSSDSRRWDHFQRFGVTGG